jgi:hypothetical protein
MLTVFWDHEGMLLTTLQPQGQTVNADSIISQAPENQQHKILWATVRTRR